MRTRLKEQQKRAALAGRLTLQRRADRAKRALFRGACDAVRVACERERERGE